MAHLAKYQSSSGDTERKLSPGIWGSFPFEEVQKYKTGVFQFDDFDKFDIGAASAATTPGYEVYLDANTTITDAALEGGVITFGSTDDNGQAALGPTIAPFKIATGSGKPLYFECRFKTSTIDDTKHNIFIGLIESGAVATEVPVNDSDALADKNLIGFWRLAGDGDKMDIVYKADGQTAQTALADAVTLVADTFTKVGFYFDGYNTIRFYKNGVPILNSSDSEQIISNTNMDAVTFPDDITLGICLHINNATGTAEGTTSFDWYAVGQVF